VPEEEVDIVRRLYEALNRGDFDRMLEGVSPECEVDMSRALWGPYQGVHRIDRFRSLLQEIIGMWESARWEVAQYTDLGEHIVAAVTGRFHGRDGVEVQAEMTWLFTFRDGAIRRVTLYQERDEALEAAGSSD
jgi:ketosteroid isomerase-like protein